MGWYLILHNIFLGKMFSSTNKMLISKIFAKKRNQLGETNDDRGRTKRVIYIFGNTTRHYSRITYKFVS